MLNSIILLAQRPMSDGERFGIMPFFMLVGIVMIFFGVNGVRNRKISGTIKDRLRGVTEVTGGMAVFKGIVLMIGGVAIIGIATTMMVLGRTLLPE